MKKKYKSILIITALAIPLFLSSIIAILVKNNHVSFGFYKNMEDAALQIKDTIDNDYKADLDINISENIKTYDNSDLDGANIIKPEDTYKDINEENQPNDPSTDELPAGNDADVIDPNSVAETDNISTDVYDTITISAAGDVTLGRDENYGWERSFDHELKLQNGDFGYFFRNVKDIFEADDLTIVNLETTLTNATKKADKKFRFKADPSYVEILKQGNIEAVSIANNHTLDFLEKGYNDTLKTLEDASVGYFGYEHKYITQIRDIKIGVLGYYCMEITDKQLNQIKQAIEELRNEGTDLVIIMFHWGIERDYWPNSVQKELAYFSIDNGADLVLGSHPHVLQGIEEYKGKQIVYSLGNFCFGGNKNPKDKDTMIYVHKFNFKNNELISEEYQVIPCSISSVQNRNNYQPTPLEGKEAERVINKIKKYSDF